MRYLLLLPLLAGCSTSNSSNVYRTDDVHVRQDVAVQRGENRRCTLHIRAISIDNHGSEETLCGDLKCNGNTKRNKCVSFEDVKIDRPSFNIEE